MKSSKNDDLNLPSVAYWQHAVHWDEEAVADLVIGGLLVVFAIGGFAM